MPLNLKQIKAPVSVELKKFEQHFRESMKSNVALLDRITYYIVKRKGKQIRPLFVFLSAKTIGGEVNDNTYVAASLIELLHTASLVHDDVVDDSMKRRGFFSVNALWKNKIAVLVGDYLLTRGLAIALAAKQYTQLEIVSEAVRLMSEGELLQIEKARRLDIKEDIYYEIIRQKTASLIASACSAGAASVTTDEKVIEQMRFLGENIGMAFQIKDDLFDYGDDNIGKPRGIDIKEKKMTLPLIYALNKAPKATRKKLINYIKKDSTNPAKVKEIISYVKSSGGMEYAEEVMNAYQKKAYDILAVLPENEAKQAIYNLIEFVTTRKK